MGKHKHKSEFKDEYILTKGHPYAIGVGPKYTQLCMCSYPSGVGNLKSFDFPIELWSLSHPEYELVLRKVKINAKSNRNQETKG